MNQIKTKVKQVADYGSLFFGGAFLASLFFNSWKWSIFCVFMFTILVNASTVMYIETIWER